MRYLLPGFEWVTPANSSWEITNPSSSTTILDKWLALVDLEKCVATNEVEIVRRSVNDPETFLDNRNSIGG